MGLGRFFKVQINSKIQLIGTACAAPVKWIVRLDYDPVLETGLPTGDGTNQARYIAPRLTAGIHALDWYYDSPVDQAKWKSTTELLVDEATLFRHHKKTEGEQHRPYGIIVLEVVP